MIETAEQGALIEAFAAGRVLGVEPPKQHIMTHLSHVFLTSVRAYKLKRAVKLPFVDFTTLAQRRAACESELEVNRRFAAPLYLGVQAFVRRDGAFALSDEGEAVDYAVIMRRFADGDRFDQLARAGKLTPQMIVRTAEHVAEVHRATAGVLDADDATGLAAVIEGLRATEQDGAARLRLKTASTFLFEKLEAELVRLTPLLEARRGQGKVRRGHGDLHLRNICLFEGVPTPFDALEFDDKLATADVLYDIAFLLMDLRRLGLLVHANAALNAYWDAADEDEAALSALPFFMALRATVRMAVALEAGDVAESQSYRALALKLLEPCAPAFVAIGGLSGTGKSAVAAAVALHQPGAAGARLLRSDVVRKRRLHLAQTAHAGAESYTAQRRADVYDDIVARSSAAFAAGASIVADATFKDDAARMHLESRAGACLRCYWLHTPKETRLARVAQRRDDASDADVEVAAQQQEPHALLPCWRIIDATGTLADVVDAIRRDLDQ